MDTNSLHREPTSAHSKVSSDAALTEHRAERQVLLTNAQQTALEWLLTGGSVTEAAQLAGVSRQAVSGWLHNDPDFQSEYERWRQQSLAIAHARMVAMTEAAVDNLSFAVRERHDLKASEFLLKHVAAAGKK